MKNKSLLELSNNQLRDYLFQSDKFCTIGLPNYFDFNKLLLSIYIFLINNPDYIKDNKASNYEGVNYLLLNNKDGKFSWRPMQIINPFLYVKLINIITDKENWNYLTKRLLELQSKSRIKCMSIPIYSEDEEVHQAKQILNWWEEIEQQSIELSLKYDYIFETDITDCYGSIYTHSISWALHTKDEAKNKRFCKDLLGNQIDSLIRNMSYGQTNGIPQGSVVMDLIAEIVLIYLDHNISTELKNTCINDNYEILRYRDDYRIFINNIRDGELILKIMTEELHKLGFKLNPSKTNISDDIITSSIKKDKLTWLFRKQAHKNNIQKKLLIIHNHSKIHPNSGSLLEPLNIIFNQLKKKKNIDNVKPLISIVAEIFLKNPRTIPVCTAILSYLLQTLNETESKNILIEIQNKFKKIPNTGLLDIWLQRLTLPVFDYNDFYDPLSKLLIKLYSSYKLYSNDKGECFYKLLANKDYSIWNNEWIDIPEEIDINDIINYVKIESLSPVISNKEFNIFDHQS